MVATRSDNTDDLTLAQLSAIQAEVRLHPHHIPHMHISFRPFVSQIAAAAPLVGPIQSTLELLHEYDDPVFQAKIRELAARYPTMRRTRGDGFVR